jgi:hypothetical protein
VLSAGLGYHRVIIAALLRLLPVATLVAFDLPVLAVVAVLVQSSSLWLFTGGNRIIISIVHQLQ